MTAEMWGIVGAALAVGVSLTAFVLNAAKRAAIAEIKAQLETQKVSVDDCKSQLSAAKAELDKVKQSEAKLQRNEAALLAKIDAEQKSHKEKEELLVKAEAKLSDSFKALSQDALKASQEQFLQLAKTSFKAEQDTAKQKLDQRVDAVERLVKPINQSLEKAQEQVQQIEKAREGAYAALKQQVEHMHDAQKGLRHETAQLVKALRQPTGRGQWGEMQLRRVVEMSGMQEHCDFETQTTTTDDEGKRLRPDLIVKLPGGQRVVVDSKAPMDAYLDALEIDDEVAKEAALVRHAQQVKTHIQQLSSKKYQDQFETSPEFVVLFLPSEAFFSAALSQDSSLIEKGVDQGVILATPTTLIALLRAVSYGWRQEALAKNAQEISGVGRELYERLCKFTEYVDKMGKSLGSTVSHFNSAVGSLDSRVLVSARKFEELGATTEQTVLSEVKPVERIVREVKCQQGSVSEKEAEGAALDQLGNLDSFEPVAGFGDFAGVSTSESDFEGFLAEGEGEGI